MDISPLEIVKVLNFKTIALVRAIKFDNLTIECEEIWLSSGSRKRISAMTKTSKILLISSLMKVERKLTEIVMQTFNHNGN